MVGDINLVAVVGATITTVGPSVMAVQWSETLIYGSHQSHYFGSLGTGGIRQSHYFNNPPTSESLFDNIVGGETNPAVFVEATISAVRPSNLHHKRFH